MKSKFKEMKRKIMKKYLWSDSKANYLKLWFVKSENYYIYRFMLYLRKYEYLIQQKTSILMKVRRVWCLRQYQRYAMILGFVIGDGVLGDDITFYHKGNIMINPAARVGDGCKFHGDCCIGVARTGETGCPVLGKNVDIGIGARILGDIYIADDITIGANSVVTESFYEPGVIIAGIPAKIIRKK